VTLVAAFALARKLVEEKYGNPATLDTPEAVADLMREEARLRGAEVLQVLRLNTRRRLIGKAVKIADGTLIQSSCTRARFSNRQSPPARRRSFWVHNHPAAIRRLPKPTSK